jgi:hypothetical protein
MGYGRKRQEQLRFSREDSKLVVVVFRFIPVGLNIDLLEDDISMVVVRLLCHTWKLACSEDINLTAVFGAVNVAIDFI